MSLTVAYVSHTHSYAESHTYRAHVAHMSHTCRTRITHISHTYRTFIAHISHTYRTRRTHFWLSLCHGAMTSVLFQVRRLNFVLQTCLINSLNSRDTYCTCYWMFIYMFNVHSKYKLYPCMKSHCNHCMTERWRFPLILFSFAIYRIAT